MKPTKRLFDLFWAAFGLILLSPIFAAVALGIKLADGGPVFFRQERIGLGGKPFRIWKFRTMTPNAEKLGGQLTVGRDPRITSAGHFLRKTKLDELPQLINVFVGEMSLVGPRPEVAHYVAQYTAEQREVLNLVPGITDLASIKYRNESNLLSVASDPDKLYAEEIMPDKIRINLSYARQANVMSDFLVIIRTIFGH